MSAAPTEGVSRRAVIKRAGIVGGATLVATPLVETVFAPMASASLGGQPSPVTVTFGLPSDTRQNKADTMTVVATGATSGTLTVNVSATQTTNGVTTPVAMTLTSRPSGSTAVGTSGFTMAYTGQVSFGFTNPTKGVVVTVTAAFAGQPGGGDASYSFTVAA